MDEPVAALTNPEIQKLKTAAQRLKPILKIGKNGVTPQFIQSLDAAFASHELVKVRFDEFKDEKKILARDLATKTGSHLITVLGNVAVFYRRKVERGEGVIGSVSRL